MLSLIHISAVQRDGHIPAGIQQLGHGGLVQRAIGGQRTDDEAVCPSIPQGVDLGAQPVSYTHLEAREAMSKLCEYVDVCISNEEDAKDVFGIEAEATDIYGGKLNAEGYKSVAKQLADKFHFEKVAITLRESHNASENGWSAMLYDVASNEYCFSKKYELKIIDRVGGGDSFGGGLIYALLNGKSTQDAVEFAVAASALKHTIEGDYNMMTVSEVEKLAGGDGSGRIQR